MSERSTVLRSLHDVGAGRVIRRFPDEAVALNGAARAEGGTGESATRIAACGRSKWEAVDAAAISAHLVGNSGLPALNAARVVAQQGVTASTLVKTVLTGVALAAMTYSGVLGKLELASSDRPEGAQKVAEHPVDTEAAQRHLTFLQWAVPALTGGLLTLNAVHNEQQRPAE
ncbi:hypothetical protein [Streptomyces sp. NPDC055681]